MEMAYFDKTVELRSNRFDTFSQTNRVVENGVLGVDAICTLTRSRLLKAYQLHISAHLGGLAGI